MSATEGKFRLSPFVQTLRLNDTVTVVSHALRVKRNLLSNDMLDSLMRFQPQGLTLDEFVAGELAATTARRVFDFFVISSFIVRQGEDEVAAIRESVLGKEPLSTHESQSMAAQHHIRAPAVRSLASFDCPPWLAEATPKTLTVLILGLCFTHIVADELENLGASIGLEITVVTGSFLDFHLIEKHQPGLVIFQPSVETALLPLWNGAAFISDAQRAERVEGFKAFLTFSIGQLLTLSKGRLILVHGLTAPQHSPHGRGEFRLKLGLEAGIQQLNDLIRGLLRGDPNAMYFDEPRVLANAGKARLMDDMFAPYAHYSSMSFWTAWEPFAGARSPIESFGAERGEATRLFAQEYLDCYTLWSGRGRIKCVVVDLDDTLWPGVLGERTPGAAIEPRALNSFNHGLYGGIHQALKILKQRGVLLAACSKNDEADAFAFWDLLTKTADELGMHHLLRREDFVLHKINWRRKSENIAEIAAQLGVGLDAMLFIDDSAIEREDAHQSHPKLRLLGSDLNLVRLHLLRDPCLQVNVPSEEGQTRTEMVRAQLSRDEIRRESSDEASFLASLQIRATVTRVRQSSQLARIVELIQRTNQFNTTQHRHDHGTLEAFVSDEQTEVWSLHAADRFTSYGLVGAIILRAGAVDTFVLSCRVLALKLAVPFLVTALRHGGLRDRPVTGKIVVTARNEPCRTVFVDAGFSAAADAGDHALFDWARLQTVDQKIYRIEVTQESR